MGIKIYNTAKRMKMPFVPLDEGKVGMYVCGVTVYDLCHIGHARSQIVFDVLSRYLRARGYDVTYVRNFTDIDDKIINRAREEGRGAVELAEHYIKEFYQDMDELGVLRPEHEPRATEHIDGMIRMIQSLIQKGHAYETDGDVYFSVESFKGYGELSGRSLDDMIAGSRVAVDEKKRHPMDFALWKKAKEGEPAWPSPWSDGRPGWHMECSVMSTHYLGITFDIHGGGKDLLFPHHENERAQSIGAYGGEFARYWVHNGFVTVESEKMSKSLGNFLTIRDALKKYSPELLRIFLLSKHYRNPLDFTEDAVSSLNSGLIRIYRALMRLEEILGPHEIHDGYMEGELKDPVESPFLSKFTEIMDDDLNTAGAIGLIFEKIRDINRVLDSGDTGEDIKQRLKEERDTLFIAGNVLGIFQESPREFFERLSSEKPPISKEEIERLIEERAQARAQKDWKKADAIRDKLKNMGIVLEDTKKGTTWRFDV